VAHVLGCASTVRCRVLSIVHLVQAFSIVHKQQALPDTECQLKLIPVATNGSLVISTWQQEGVSGTEQLCTADMRERSQNKAHESTPSIL
jgi:hypothetical protein